MSWIHTRILVGFLLLLAMLVAVGGFALGGLERQQKAAEQAAAAHDVGANLLRAESAHLRFVRTLESMFLTGQVVQEPVKPTECAFGRWYYSFEPDEDYRDQYLSLERPHQRIHEVGHRIWEAFAGGRREEAAQALNTELAAALDVMAQGLDSLKARIDELAEASEAGALRTHERLQGVTLALLLAAVFTALITGRTTAQAIAKPLGALAGAAREVAGGDLRVAVAIPGAKGEVATLAEAFRTMVSSLRSLVEVVNRQSANAGAAADSLAEAAFESGRAAEQVGTTMQSVAGNSNDLAGRVDRLGGLANGLGEAAEEAQRLSAQALAAAGATTESVTQGNGAVQRAIDQLTRVTETVNFATDAIRKLGQRSEEIGNIVHVISGLAAQTNLLSLNAAIEAARAGEQGRGFSVVADEVRKLASESREAAKSITDLIEDIISETTVTVNSMEFNAEEVQRQLDIISSAGRSLGEILERARNTQAISERLKLLAEQLKARAEELHQSLAVMNSAVQENAASTQEVAAASQQQNATSEEVAALAQGLREMVSELHEAVSALRV